MSKHCWMKPMFLFIMSFLAFGTPSQGRVLQKATSQGSASGLDSAKSLLTNDTMFIIHFHPTVQCSCCINVGNFSKKALEKYYTKPYKDGRIVFSECNIDEDSLTAKKYQIFGSALGFKKLIKGKEEFKEVESVWEFCEDEGKFLPNFKRELDEFAGGSPKEKPQTKAQDKKTSP
ncbi:MAG: nitrophenyl compound nitroreductase subunit ArsF family protein [Candidatus Zixiibacteriota bacterium]